VRNGSVLTSIFKSPVAGRVAIVGHNIAGDQQSDLRVHGGPYKAVYCYPEEHYPFWKGELPGLGLAGMDLPYGMFGENLTTEGLNEQDVCIGDRLRAGSALLQVTQPRMPCFKLAIRFDRSDMVKRFWQSGRSGFYLSVVEEGDVAAGDSLEITARDPERVSLADVVRMYRGGDTREELFERIQRSPLFGSWKRDLRDRRSALQFDFSELPISEV